MMTALIFALAFLMGSVPFGLLLTQAFTDQDLRKIGSGNIGATNVLRTGNKGLALATVLLDGGKAFMAVILIQRFGDAGEIEAWWPALAALGAVSGHCFSPWLKFQGGKGVASFLGAWLALSGLGFMALVVWIVVAAIWRRSSLAALSASFSAPLLLVGDLAGFGLMALLSLIIWGRHAANIRRLWDGSEPKIGES